MTVALDSEGRARGGLKRGLAMRNLISGVVGIVLGGLILLTSLLSGGPRGEGAYGVGQTIGLVFALLLFGAGIFYLVMGIRGLSQPPKEVKRRRKRPREYEEDEERPRRKRPREYDEE
jgi:hypothetical protein